MSPTLLIAVTAPLSALGLYLFGQTTTPAMWYAAAALLAIGRLWGESSLARFDFADVEAPPEGRSRLGHVLAALRK